MPPQQEFLRHTALDYRIYQQDVPALQIRGSPERNFASRVPAVLNVADILANKMANYRDANMPDQIRSENEAAIQRNYHIQAPFVGPSDFFAESGYPCGNAPGRIGRGSPGAH